MSLYVSILCSHMSVCNMCLLCTFAFGCPHMSNIWPCSFATGALTDVTFVRVRLPFVFHTCIRVRLPFVFHTRVRVRWPFCVDTRVAFIPVCLPLCAHTVVSSVR